jgi:hypothetical protein
MLLVLDLRMMLGIENLLMKCMNNNLVYLLVLNGNQKQLVGQIWLEN